MSQNEHHEEGEAEGAEYDNEEEEAEVYEEDSAADDDMFKNNHDLIGLQGILRAQKNEIDKKKVSFRFLSTIWTFWVEMKVVSIFIAFAYSLLLL